MLDKWNDSFAKNQLEKYGWQKGEGLGKNKHGNTKHIAVTVKNDTKGIGGNQQQWDFAWWDHLYNKSAKSVAVEKDESNEVKVSLKKKSEDRKSRTGIISTHRPTGTTKEAAQSSMADIADAQNLMDDVKKVHSSMAQVVARTSLYGGFVKSAKVLVGSESPAAGSESNNTSDNDCSDDEQKDYSIKMDDQELFAACEGRTARKGGRGLVEQKGKYARVMKDYLRDRKEDDDDEKTEDKKRKRDDGDETNEKKKKKKRKDESISEDKKKKDKKKKRKEVKDEEEKSKKKKSKKEKKDKKEKKKKH